MKSRKFIKKERNTTISMIQLLQEERVEKRNMVKVKI